MPFFSRCLSFGSSLESPKIAAIYLYMNSENSSDFSGNLEMKVIGADKKVKTSDYMEFQHYDFTPGYGWGSKFIYLNDLFKPHLKYLSEDNTLTLNITVS
jgi:hypothetical protein